MPFKLFATQCFPSRHPLWLSLTLVGALTSVSQTGYSTEYASTATTATRTSPLPLQTPFQVQAQSQSKSQANAVTLQQWQPATFESMTRQLAPRHSQLAIGVVDLHSGQALYQHNIDTLMQPASTQKLLTAVAATAQLGNAFRFTTALYSQSVNQQGELNGDLYIRFSGDPSLTRNDLSYLIQQLFEQGVHTIKGNVYLVGQAEEQLRAPGWVWDDLGICYAAPVSQFVIDRNCIFGELTPQLGSNHSQLNFPKDLPVTLTTSAQFDKNNQRALCDLALQRLPNNHFHLSGCFAGNQALKLAIAINEPALYAQQVVTQLFGKSNVRLSGNVQLSNQVNKQTKLLAQHHSAALPELLSTMLLTSDNLIADSLFKALGADVYQQPGTFLSGAKAMKQVLTDEGIDLDYGQIIDGSGLSRYNLLSARQLTQVLLLIYQDERFRSLLAQLPLAGRSGSLRYKSGYRQAPLQDKVRAKTGSMQGVDNLAGYLSLNAEDNLLFVILENGIDPQQKQTQPMPFSAQWLTALLKESQPTPSQ